MLRLFQDSFIFGEATYSRVNYFVTTVSFSEQLFLQSSCFFEELFFQNNRFFLSSYFFQNSYFFRATLLASSHSLRVESSSEQLLFGTGIFLTEELFRIKISTAELLFPSRCFCTASMFSEKLLFGKKLTFQKSNIPHYLLFLESYLFRAATFSKDTASFPQLHFLFISFFSTSYVQLK